MKVGELGRGGWFVSLLFIGTEKTEKVCSESRKLYTCTRGLRRAGSVRPAQLVPVPAGTGFRD